MAVIKQSNQSSPRGTCRFSIWILLATNLMVFLVTWNLGEVGDEQTLPQTVDTHKTASSAGSVGGGYSLVPNTGKAMALPSIRVRKDTSLPETIYGGKGDKPHLGGFTDMDHHGVSPKAWSWMVKNVGVKSVIDVGCGRGISTSWFYFHGLDVLCAEGSHDAIENTMLPDPSLIVEHDFSQGPWWPEKTYDAVWCVEFLEHVGRNLQKNYMPAFRKAAIIFASHSNWGGHHHVEVHDDEYWIAKFAMHGFVYSEPLTKTIRREAHSERNKGVAANGNDLNPQHVWLTMLVFINPAVASLPEHAHLLADPGCYLTRGKSGPVNRECGEVDPKFPGQKQTADMESVLPQEFRALKITEEQDKQWFEHVKARVKQHEPSETKK